MNILPLIFLLGSLVCIPSVAHSYSMIEEHWQEGKSVGIVEINGTLKIKNVSWIWQASPIRLSELDTTLAGLKIGRTGMSLISQKGVRYYILEGHTSSLTSARPGLRPSVSMLQFNSGADEARIQIQGESTHGQVRYGDATFKINHVLAYQDQFMADSGWGVVGRKLDISGISQRIVTLFYKIFGYDYQNKASDHIVQESAFTGEPDKTVRNAGYGEGIAGAWITSLEDIYVNFPGSEESVKRWQGILTPVIYYF